MTTPGINQFPAPSRAVHNGIRVIMNEALALNNPDLIRLEIGEPDFPTPPNIVEAAHRAALAGHTRYTSNAGIPPLREALADKIKRVNGFDVSPESIVVTNGGVEALFVALTAIVKPGDEILIPDPAWPNYMSIPAVMHAETVGYTLRPEHGFLPSVAELEQLTTERTTVLMLNSPSNPVGTVFPRELLVEIAEFARRRGIWIISDECYDQVVFDDTFVSTAAVTDYERVISVYTFSKTYAMTGWRVGYLACPPELTETVVSLQEPIVACVNTPAQYAAIEALTGTQEPLDMMVSAYRRRRDAAVAQFKAAGINMFCPAGAFYLWLDCQHPSMDGTDIALALLREHGVAVGPGPAFGRTSTGFIRLSLAASDEALAEGIQRILASGYLDGARPETRHQLNG
ncbi:pyridoxal phosphate-dependent aminotransferase [Paenarthrobacter sp. NPDC090522]|uniref:pyridoxal phosphate-dependent aminotransferase n=1 Tax=Paenarthrobacter sp. NPDC090522 TaxID=3364383 RepID=UPI0037FFFE1A